MGRYIRVGKLNNNILNQINIKLVTEKVIFTYERIGHVKEKRVKLYNDIMNMLPNIIYNPDYIYKDWNNRKNILVFISSLNEQENIDIVIKIAIENDNKHTKNSIITMFKIGEKTFSKK